MMMSPRPLLLLTQVVITCLLLLFFSSSTTICTISSRDVPHHQVVHRLEKSTEVLSPFTSLYTNEYISKFNNSGIRELFRLFQHTKCQYRRDGHCVSGTVQDDPWLKHALQTQFHLARNDPISIVQFPASHNSFNTRSDGYGGKDSLLRQVLQFFYKDTDLVIAQQEYSMTDQLNFGVRMLHLDPIWFLNKLVMCHGGTRFEWFDKLVKIVEQALHKKIEYDSNQIGCTPFDRSWSSGIQEIASWVRDNPNEIVMVYINDAPHWDWNHHEELLGPIMKYMGNLVFTPKDRMIHFPNATDDDYTTWPSMTQLKAWGKRIVLVGSSEYATLNGTWIHMPQWTGYPGKNVNRFDGWPSCTRRDEDSSTKTSTTTAYSFTEDWSCVSGESNVFGPFYDGPGDMGLITPGNMQQFLDCGVKMVAMDQVSPALVQNMIWTWAKGEPRLDHRHSCVYMQLHVAPETPSIDTNYRGTWYTGTCNQTLPVACESKFHKGRFLVGPIVSLMNKHRGDNNNNDYCPPGYQFTVPNNSYYSKLLQEEMMRKHVTKVWIAYQAES